MMNQITLVGRIVRDPEVKELENGKKVSNITVAVNRSYKNSDGEYETDFIDCSVWNRIADSMAEYCRKGDLVAIRGCIQTRVVETEKGKHNEPYVVAERVSFVSKSKDKIIEGKQDDELEV